MKIKGIKVDCPCVETIVFPRQSGELVFTARPVVSYEEFDALFKRPTPEYVTKPGEEAKPDVENPTYKQQLDEYQKARFTFMIIKSLTSGTEGLEFETVNLLKPDTYKNLDDELTSTGLQFGEILRLYETVLAANGLNSKKIDEATKNFIATSKGKG